MPQLPLRRPGPPDPTPPASAPGPLIVLDPRPTGSDHPPHLGPRPTLPAKEPPDVACHDGEGAPAGGQALPPKSEGEEPLDGRPSPRYGQVPGNAGSER